MQLSRKIQPAAAEEDKTGSTFEHNHILHLYVTLRVLCRSLTGTHAAACCPTTWQRFIAWLIWSQRSFTSLWALSFGRLLESSFVAEPRSFILALLGGTRRQAQERPLTKPITEGYVQMLPDSMGEILILKKSSREKLCISHGLMQFKTMQQYHCKDRLNKIFPHVLSLTHSF